MSIGHPKHNCKQVLSFDCMWETHYVSLGAHKRVASFFLTVCKKYDNIQDKFEVMQSTFFFAMTSHPFVMICIIDVKKSYHYKICITLSVRDVFLFQNDDHSKYFHNKNTHTMLCVCLNNKCFCLQMLNTTEYNTNE